MDSIPAKVMKLSRTCPPVTTSKKSSLSFMLLLGFFGTFRRFRRALREERLPGLRTYIPSPKILKIA